MRSIVLRELDCGQATREALRDFIDASADAERVSHRPGRLSEDIDAHRLGHTRTFQRFSIAYCHFCYLVLVSSCLATMYIVH
jgi:hypothetical protein